MYVSVPSTIYCIRVRPCMYSVHAYKYHEFMLMCSIYTAQEIGSITSNYSLGFGSFVDKPTAPYISTRPDM